MQTHEMQGFQNCMLPQEKTSSTSLGKAKTKPRKESSCKEVFKPIGLFFIEMEDCKGSGGSEAQEGKAT